MLRIIRTLYTCITHYYYIRLFLELHGHSCSKIQEYIKTSKFETTINIYYTSKQVTLRITRQKLNLLIFKVASNMNGNTASIREGTIIKITNYQAIYIDYQRQVSNIIISTVIYPFVLTYFYFGHLVNLQKHCCCKYYWLYLVLL